MDTGENEAQAGVAEPLEVELVLMGPAALFVGTTRRAVLSPQDAAWLAIVALDGPQPAASLRSKLWPDQPAKRTANNLRQHVKRLRKVAGHQVVGMTNSVALLPEVKVDVREMSLWPPDKLLSAGEFLPGHDLSDSEALEDWLATARKKVAMLRAQAMVVHVEKMEASGEVAQALPLALAAVDLLPLGEHVWRLLMRLHYLRNDRSAALAAFDRMEQVLLHELGTRPSPETLELLQTIESSRPSTARASRSIPVSLIHPPVMVGRDEAWAAMSRAWKSHDAFLVVGDAGIGKSRLLQEFARAQPGVLHISARTGDKGTPYALLARVLLAVRQQFAPDVPEATTRDLAHIAPQFGKPWPAPTQTLSLWHAAEAYLSIASRAGLKGLLVDDLQLADLATVEALQWLSGSDDLASLGLGIGTRPLDGNDIAPCVRQWLTDSRRPQRIDLGPLSPSELAQLLATLALPSLLDAKLAKQLHQHAGGHPLFTLATLQDAVAHGRELVAGGLPRPTSVHALLQDGLRDLPAAAMDLLRVAAVAGPDLSVDLAALVLDCAPMSLADAWGILERANVLKAERFAHDLVHEAALTLVPRGLRQSLHRRIAGILASIAAVPPARIADHWERGESWAEAGHCWFAAARAARRSARLDEHAVLLENAARCHCGAGDRDAEFEARWSMLDSLQIRKGGAAVLEAEPSVAALAITAEQRLRCKLSRVEALLDLHDKERAAAEAEEAAGVAQHFPALRPDALGLLALALAQCGRDAEALRAGELALDLARNGTSDAAVVMRSTRALAYVHYAGGRLGAAVPLQHETVALAEALGDHAEAAAADGNVVGILAAIGDVPKTYAHAIAIRNRYKDMGMATASTLAAVNHVLLGAAAAYKGRFCEAIEALAPALDMAKENAAPLVQAKARIAMSNVWLTLGDAAHAVEIVEKLPRDLPPGVRMQVALCRARAEQLAGRTGARFLAQMTRLVADHPVLRRVMSADYEASFQGEATQAITLLRTAAEECASLGLYGTSRSLQARLLVRLLDVPGEEALASALALARALLPSLPLGFSAKVYVPELWWHLDRAFAAAGDKALAKQCLAAARAWILEEAMPHVPKSHRDSFLSLNPSNRALLAVG